MYKAGDGTGEDGLCIDIVGWHAVQGESGKKPLQTMVLCYIIMLYILHQNPNLYQKNPNPYQKNPNPYQQIQTKKYHIQTKKSKPHHVEMATQQVCRAVAGAAEPDRGPGTACNVYGRTYSQERPSQPQK